MPYSMYRTDERELNLIAEVRKRYRVHITGTEARALQFLIDLRCATYDDIDAHLWPDEDGFEADFHRRCKVHVHRLRKKFGALINIVTFYGQGYALKRLGPESNPMHERK